MITVYSKPQCVQCNATYTALDKKGIEYEVIDVTVDAVAMDKIVEMGFYQAPVVVAGDMAWSGFRPDMIAKAAMVNV
jgi:glutaredoxin-like protein NrdH